VAECTVCTNQIRIRYVAFQSQMFGDGNMYLQNYQGLGAREPNLAALWLDRKDRPANFQDDALELKVHVGQAFPRQLFFVLANFEATESCYTQFQ
jgi:hypothetical protein